MDNYCLNPLIPRLFVVDHDDIDRVGNLAIDGGPSTHDAGRQRGVADTPFQLQGTVALYGQGSTAIMIAIQSGAYPAPVATPLCGVRPGNQETAKA